MGNISSAESYIEEEIQRITGNSSTKVLVVPIPILSLQVLDHILQFDPKSYEFEPTHLGTLFAIDKNKDGKFDREELREFAQIYLDKSLSSQSTDFQVSMLKGIEIQAQFKGYLTLLMWTDVSKDSGTQLFVDWYTLDVLILMHRLSKLFSENLAIHHFESVPGVIFLSRDTIKTLHQVNQRLILTISF